MIPPHRSVPTLLLVATMVSLAPPGVSLAASRSDLGAAQGRLDRITVITSSFTGAWMAMQARVKSLQARERSARSRLATASPADKTLLRRAIRRVDATLSPLLPSWLRVKRVLHDRYREVRALLRTVATSAAFNGKRSGAPSRILRRRAEPPVSVCPVAGPTAFVESFGAPRPGGRIHEGEDLLAPRRTPAWAVANGRVVRDGNALGGRAVLLYLAGGYAYYAHFSAYGASGPVRAGEVVGYVGTSGDARGLIPHVHFEYHPGGGAAVSTFRDLRRVC